jgi:hypothetical protein
MRSSLFQITTSDEPTTTRKEKVELFLQLENASPATTQTYHVLFQ